LKIRLSGVAEQNYTVSYGKSQMEQASTGITIEGHEGSMVFNELSAAIQKFIEEGKHPQIW